MDKEGKINNSSQSNQGLSSQNVRKKGKKISLKFWITLAVFFYLGIGLIVYLCFFKDRKFYIEQNNKNKTEAVVVTEIKSDNTEQIKQNIEKSNNESLVKEEKQNNYPTEKVVEPSNNSNSTDSESIYDTANLLIPLINQGDKEAEKMMVGIIGIYIKKETPNGIKVERDDVWFAKCFKCLFENSDKEMQHILLTFASMLTLGKDENGKDIEPNYYLAGDCYKLFAEKGNTYASQMLFVIGFMLVSGNNPDGEKVEINIPEGIKYLKLAAGYGIKEAQALLIKLNNDGVNVDERGSYTSQEEKTNNNNENSSLYTNPTALGASQVVTDFYNSYLKNVGKRGSWITENKLTPRARQIFSMLSFIIWDYDFIIDGQDYGNTWNIKDSQVFKETAQVILENSYNGQDARNIKIICKYINGKWFIDDIGDTKNRFYSFLNSNSNLAVVKESELPIYSDNFGKETLTFYDKNNRIIPLRNFKQNNNNYTIDFYEENTHLCEKIDSELLVSPWVVKRENVIPFSFLNKIKKGEDKYMAYIVLGEPSEDSSNKLFYSPEDYISYDKEGKITSWNGFEDLKEFFDDGSSFNIQNIGYVNAKSGINLRKAPNTKSEKVSGLPYNCQVMILEKNGPQATFENITSNWCLVTDGTKVGWAFGGFIKAN